MGKVKCTKCGKEWTLNNLDDFYASDDIKIKPVHTDNPIVAKYAQLVHKKDKGIITSEETMEWYE